MAFYASRTSFPGVNFGILKKKVRSGGGTGLDPYNSFPCDGKMEEKYPSPQAGGGKSQKG